VGDPYTARVRVGRRHHREVLAERPGHAEALGPSGRERLVAFASGLRGRRRAMAVAVALVCLAVSVLAVLADLSPLDPTGPGLGWSPGVILIALIVALLLVGSHDETD
jgi:hypothetical protein